MRKLFTILISLIILTLVQCKPTPEDENDNAKVRISCEIPINNGGKSDFSNLMGNGTIYWSEGEEYVYLAIPHTSKARLVELAGFSYGYESTVQFSGEAPAGLLEEGKEYEIWYFGNSKKILTPYISVTNNKIEGNISTQNGQLENLGYYHIAKVKVQAVKVGDEVVLELTGSFENQMAIAYLDLDVVVKIQGEAMAGTKYALQYNKDKNEYEFVVTKPENDFINVRNAAEKSYIVLFPNGKETAMLEGVKRDGTIMGIEFIKEIEANTLYCKQGNNGMLPLSWFKISDGPSDQYEYVDLGLPSGVKWATRNVGAATPEAKGNYYAWGEVDVKSKYVQDNSKTYNVNMSDISGNEKYDAATANWGGKWRMPTRTEMRELIDNCDMQWTTYNGANGIKFTSKNNGKTLFMPSAGWKKESGGGESSYCYYWGSTPNNNTSSYVMSRSNGDKMNISSIDRSIGHVIRPVRD